MEIHHAEIYEKREGSMVAPSITIIGTGTREEFERFAIQAYKEAVQSVVFVTESAHSKYLGKVENPKIPEETDLRMEAVTVLKHEGVHLIVDTSNPSLEPQTKAYVINIARQIRAAHPKAVVRDWPGYLALGDIMKLAVTGGNQI